ncbi:CLUMA_CG009133, isoform A [Clunio marinus]|uniref:CLUMA_CG009133, isoform A n=1 Tax=Clunio marinus TaxID=568069 RepID=A0A1J1I660_9DIPT|nr:CLUMA_CG009133, isoform A [Clunio marinus]
MHISLISILVLLSCSTIISHPVPNTKEQNDQSSPPSRPLQQFFKKILNVLLRTTTPEPPRSTTERVPTASSLYLNAEFHEIPNFVDFSTFLLDSLASNNSAIKFTYMQPEESALKNLRGEFSVISFVIPKEFIKNEDNDDKSIFGFLSSLRLPWNREPSNTVYSQFPPVLEYFTQRIQAYFSIYKHTDDSRVNNTIVFIAPELNEASSNVLSDEYYETTTETQLETSTLLDDITTELNNHLE